MSSESMDVLVVSSVLQDRKSLLQILDKLAVNVISCSTLDQAREVLVRQDVHLVFCDESLHGGGYRELLHDCKLDRRTPRVVVTFHLGEWKEYIEAMQLGVFDAVHWPLRPTDVELIVLRVARERRDTARGVSQQMVA